MQFSYMLHFFAIISAISVLAAPVPDELEGKQLVFDFNVNPGEAKQLSSEEGMGLARGNWLRRAYLSGDDVDPGTFIGDFLSLGNFGMQFRMLYRYEDHGAEDLAEAVCADSVPYVEKEIEEPESEEPSPIVGGDANKLIGVWRLVKPAKHPVIDIMIFKHETGKNKKPYLWIRKLAPQEIWEVESLEKKLLEKKKKVLKPTA